MKILIVEDDPKARSYLAKGLSESGMSCTLAPDGATALRLLGAQAFDVVLLDVMLPDLDGWQVLERMRGDGIHSPVIFLTARDAVDERVRGLRMGADDYVVKPFAFAELLARIHTVLRRRQQTGRIRAGGLELDPLSGQVTRDGRQTELTRTELQLLRCLLERRGRVTSRAHLLKAVWGLEFDPETNVVEVHVARLRKKLDDPDGAPLIRTVRGEGYVIDAGAGA